MTGFSGIGSDMIGTLIVGAGAAALMYALLHLTRKLGYPLPKWALPAGIGLAMIGYATWNEYSWASRVKAQLPDRAQVIAEGQARSALRPWTYLHAPVARIAVIDRAATRSDGQGHRIARVLLVERWRNTVAVEQGVDCEAGRLRPPEGEWQRVAADDPVLTTICREGG
ncbi:hypothetical protein [Paracoccus jeotgali]|uniref:hypothetical protein n=1 Tax=Paracoccus jeotgali TaxID=2065379 RepID=UPI0028B23EEB|nr:hypothetical protein [Paracoccus jeotgali]